MLERGFLWGVDLRAEGVELLQQARMQVQFRSRAEQNAEVSTFPPTGLLVRLGYALT